MSLSDAISSLMDTLRSIAEGFLDKLDGIAIAFERAIASVPRSRIRKAPRADAMRLIEAAMACRRYLRARGYRKRDGSWRGSKA